MGRISIISFFFAAALAAAMLFPGCTDEPSAPTPVITSHEFVWEVDTIPAFLTAKAMYGTSASNVYLAGYSTSGSTCCWHWDGLKWEEFDVEPYSGRDIADIDGVDSSFIVFLSFDPGHPNGTRATGVTAYDNGSFWEIPLPLGTRWRTCLHVVARDEIYLGGADGIQRFDGTKWEWMLDSTDAYEFEFQPRYIYKLPNGALECEAPKINKFKTDFDGEYLLRNESGLFSIIDSFANKESDKANIRFGTKLTQYQDAIFSAGYGGTYLLKGKTWNKIHAEGGRSAHGTVNNLVILSGDNLWHYNGDNTVNLYFEITTLLPNLRTLYTGLFIGGVLFIEGELRDVQRTPVIIRGRQQTD